MNNEDEQTQKFFDHARRDLFPKVRSSSIALIINGEPDPKLCMELGAAILFDKPILVVVPKGRTVPLALRTIAQKIVEIESMDDPASRLRLQEAISEMVEAACFRGRAEESEI